MGVRMTTSVQSIEKEVRQELERNRKRLIAMMQRIGEEIINGIRTGEYSNWIDRTGNLRSSIGYILVMDGAVQTEGGFQLVKGPEADGTSVGTGIGKQFAESLVSLYPNGIALIIVAGMEYAAYVEAMENKEVLAGGEIAARALVRKYIEEFNNRYSK